MCSTCDHGKNRTYREKKILEVKNKISKVYGIKF